MKLGQIMVGPPLTANEDDDVALALQIMAWAEVRHLPVMHGSRLAGVVSERDLLANADDNPRLSAIAHPAEVGSPDDDVSEAALRMVERGIGCLPIVEDGALIGIVTASDIVAARAEPAGAGAAGARVTVRAAMTRVPATATADELLREAVARMRRLAIRHLPVVDVDRRPVGMLSDRDVKAALGPWLPQLEEGGAPPRIQLLQVGQAMSRGPVAAVREDTPLREAAATLAERRIGAVPVLDAGGRIVGIVSYVDLLRAF